MQPQQLVVVENQTREVCLCDDTGFLDIVPASKQTKGHGQTAHGLFLCTVRKRDLVGRNLDPVKHLIPVPVGKREMKK